jgi:O-antigen ligase
MDRYLRQFDDLAGIETGNFAVRWMERIIFFFLFLMVVSAPHSIAATQIAWLTGMFLWVIRLFLKPRPRLFRTPLDIALWAFFGWSVITSIFSYNPAVSLDRLRGTALFLIFYFVIYNLKNLRAVRFVACALLFSCMVNVVWVPVQRLLGRGVEIHGLSPDSPLSRIYLADGTKTNLIDGDTLLTANKKKVHSPEDLVSEIERNETTAIQFYRPDFDLVVTARRADLLDGATAVEKLGFTSWKKSHNWRSSGFYGHYATYAEVMQLIASLALGLFIGSFLRKGDAAKARRGEEEKRSGGENAVDSDKARSISRLLFSSAPLLLLLTLAGMSLALLLTVTRASQLAFLISAAAMVIMVGNRKLLLGAAAIILPVAIGGLIFLQQSRQVGFFDPNDDSIKYRQTMYKDGFRLWTTSPRHFLLGVGMDSVQKYWREWGLYDGGKMAMGHFHSTLLQLLVERGLLALLLYLAMFVVYWKTLWRGLKAVKDEPPPENGLLGASTWMDRGILLGCFGGAIGFFASSVVHYNFGDAEVVMILFLLMGVSVRLTQPKPSLS